MIPLLLHTNSEYSFIWKATIGLLSKYASEYTIYWCSDDLCGFKLPSNFIYYQYNPELNWSKRIKPILDKIDSKYLIYLQEDYLLVDYINEEKILYCINFMDENKVDFMMSYITWDIIYGMPIKSKYEDYLFVKIKGHYNQPAIWTKEFFSKMVDLDITLPEIESTKSYNLSNNANCYAIIYIKSKDVSIPTLYFPHMHAINTKKWTFIRYPELKELLQSYNVNTNIIGICENWIIDYK